MGSGPVIIGDDGSPPLELQGREARQPSIARHVRIGRQHEFMEELRNANGLHTIPNASSFATVTIHQASQEDKPFTAKNKVEVYGDQGSHITVEVVSAKIAVKCNAALVNDDVAGWGRYAEQDSVVQSVLIDGKDTGFKPDGSLVRIDIALRP